VRLFRRRPRPAQVVVEAQLDYRDARIEGLHDRITELERENATLKAQLAVALIPQYMAAGLRARRRVDHDHTAVLRRR
jgi:hypothetical protein